MSPIPPGQSSFQLRVQLQDIRPIIWRRLLVPGSAHLPKFANMLCAAMGWQNYHLHQFRVGKTLYGMHLDEYPEEEIDEKGVSVLQAFREERRFFFDYDFGDGWEHEVVIELPAYPAVVGLSNIRIVTFCPEDLVFGTPRETPDIHGGTGWDVLDGKAEVLSDSGRNWTEPMVEAAHAMLTLAQHNQVHLALLTDIALLAVHK